MTPDADPPEVEVTLPRSPAFKGSPSAPANPTQVTPAAADAPTAEAINSHLAHSSPPLPFTISPFISVIIVIILVVSVSPTRCLSPFLTLMPRSHFLSLSDSHSLTRSLVLPHAWSLSLNLLFSPSRDGSLTFLRSHCLLVFPSRTRCLSIAYSLSLVTKQLSLSLAVSLSVTRYPSHLTTIQLETIGVLPLRVRAGETKRVCVRDNTRSAVSERET